MATLALSPAMNRRAPTELRDDHKNQTQSDASQERAAPICRHATHTYQRHDQGRRVSKASTRRKQQSRDCVARRRSDRMATRPHCPTQPGAGTMKKQICQNKNDENEPDLFVCEDVPDDSYWLHIREDGSEFRYQDRPRGEAFTHVYFVRHWQGYALTTTAHREYKCGDLEIAELVPPMGGDWFEFFTCCTATLWARDIEPWAA
jgi:hypothetical protein